MEITITCKHGGSCARITHPCVSVWMYSVCVGGVAAAVQTAKYCGSGLNMMLLLFIHCLWEYVDPSGLIFSLASVHCRVGVSG